MYKALNYWVFGGFTGERTPEEFIDFAAAHKLDGVELTVGDAMNVDTPEAECRRIRDYAAAKGVGLRSLATGFYWGGSLGADDETERAKAVDFTRRYLRLARNLGAETVLVIPGATSVAWDASRPVVSYRTVWEKSLESLRVLAKDAENCGVNIALENVWNRFLFSPMEWRFYLDECGSDRIGMYFDLGNCRILVRPEDYIEILGNRIKAIHVKNFAGADCAGGLHGFGDDLLKGDLDFASIFAALKKSGYTGPLTAEMVPFCRLPDMVLPDEVLAAETADKLVRLG